MSLILDKVNHDFFYGNTPDYKEGGKKYVKDRFLALETQPEIDAFFAIGPYWKVDGTTPTEMTQAEKDALIQAQMDAQTLAEEKRVTLEDGADIALQAFALVCIEWFNEHAAALGLPEKTVPEAKAKLKEKLAQLKGG